MIPASEARRVAETLMGRLKPYCERIEIAGSLRRHRPEVHDIDLLAIPKTPNSLVRFFVEERIKPSGGEKYLKFMCQGISADLYLADRFTWPTLLLIRTGSKEHNIMLAKRAKALGMKLHADGRGLATSGGNVIEIRGEADIFSALKLEYKEPWERDKCLFVPSKAC